MNVDACAKDEINRIKNEEGSSLSSIRYFPKFGEVRLLVVTGTVKQRTTELVASRGTTVMVIKASPDEWASRRLDLVPNEWRKEPIIVL